MTSSSNPRLREQELIIQKSAPLLSLWRAPFSLCEFKILDAYLSRINSHIPETRTVRFSKGELEALLGLQKIKIDELKRRVQNLGGMVTIEESSRPLSFTSITLFEKAVCYQDDLGVWQVDLTCTQSAMKYIFNVEDIGYLRYKLNSIIHLSSRYTYLLFLYLEGNRYRSTWQIEVDKLKKILGATDAFYKPFKRFNNNILKRCKRELDEKTDLHFRYETVKNGRMVTAISFSVDPLVLNDTASPKSAILPLSLSPGEKSILYFLGTACSLNGVPEFSLQECSMLYAALREIPNISGQIDVLHTHLTRFYQEMNQRAEIRPIKHRFAYLLKMIKNNTDKISS